MRIALLPPFLLGCFAALLLAEGARAEAWGPWSASPQAPVILTRADREAPPADPRDRRVPGISGTPYIWLVRFYQKGINPVYNGRCDMYPTCSAYSLEAIRKHGSLIGVMMTADRLFHEGAEERFVPRITVGGRYRFHDPVAANDFWWAGGGTEK